MSVRPIGPSPKRKGTVTGGGGGGAQIVSTSGRDALPSSLPTCALVRALASVPAMRSRQPPTGTRSESAMPPGVISRMLTPPSLPSASCSARPIEPASNV